MLQGDVLKRERCLRELAHVTRGPDDRALVRVGRDPDDVEAVEALGLGQHLVEEYSRRKIRAPKGLHRGALANATLAHALARERDDLVVAHDQADSFAGWP